MKENIDTTIKRKIEKEKIDIPETYFVKVNQTLMQLPEKNYAGQRVSKARWSIVAVASMCILLSGTVIAAVNYYQQRMQQMTEAEKENMVDAVQSSQADADSFSRSFTEEEKERIEELKISYLSEGQFPQDEIEVVDKKNTDEVQKLVFVMEDSVFMLPERQLSDEEMLEIIDFIYKRDYSLMEANNSEHSSVVQADENIEEKAVEQAKKFINKFYGIEIDTSTAVVEVGQYNLYRLEIPEKNQGIYRCSYDLNEEKIVEVEYSLMTEMQVGDIAVDEKLFNEKGIEVYQAIQAVNAEKNVSEFYCDYNHSAEGMLERGIVSYIGVRKDGMCYVAKYDFNLNNVTNVFMISYHDYQQLMEQNASKREKRGIKRNRIVLTENIAALSKE